MPLAQASFYTRPAGVHLPLTGLSSSPIHWQVSLRPIQPWRVRVCPTLANHSLLLRNLTLTLCSSSRVENVAPIYPGVGFASFDRQVSFSHTE